MSQKCLASSLQHWCWVIIVKRPCMHVFHISDLIWVFARLGIRSLGSPYTGLRRKSHRRRTIPFVTAQRKKENVAGGGGHEVVSYRWRKSLARRASAMLCFRGAGRKRMMRSSGAFFPAPEIRFCRDPDLGTFLLTHAPGAFPPLFAFPGPPRSHWKEVEPSANPRYLTYKLQTKSQYSRHLESFF